MRTAAPPTGNALLLRTPPRTWIVPLLAALVIVWSQAFLAIKICLQTWDAWQLVAIRALIVQVAFVIVLGWGARHETLRLLREHPVRITVMGLLAAIGYHTCLNLGMEHLSPGTSSLVVTLNPAATWLLAMLLLGERFTWRRLFGIVIAFAGVVLVATIGEGGVSVPHDRVIALLIAIGAPISWAFYSLLAKPLTKTHPPVVMTGLALILGGTPALLWLPRDVAHYANVPTLAWACVAYLAVLSTVGAYVIWGWALQALPAGRVATVAYLIPIGGVATSVLLGYQPLSLGLIAGGAIVLGGVYLAQH